MVKNTKGGKGSKSVARKLIHQEHNSFLRKPDNDFESFAVVTKMFGPMCEISLANGTLYKCHIRGKFKGRNKRNSIIATGSIVIVGFRDFEAPNFKTCDLLEVFDKDEIFKLSKLPGVDIQPFIAIANGLSNHNHNPQHNNDLFDFSNFNNYDNNTNEQLHTTPTNYNEQPIQQPIDFDIDIDDI